MDTSIKQQSEPVDPTTVTDPAPPAFPLSQNELQDLMEYRRTSQGQLSVVSRVNRPPGAHICYVTTHYEVPASTWSSFQTSPTTHAEFNSALVYMNHSCAPTVELEVYQPDADGCYPNGRSGEFRVVPNRPLQVGDEMTWFYPSTEFISPRPFTCLCDAGSGICIEKQQGANFLPLAVLERHLVNRHIRQLLEKREGLPLGKL